MGGELCRCGGPPHIRGTCPLLPQLARLQQVATVPDWHADARELLLLRGWHLTARHCDENRSRAAVV